MSDLGLEVDKNSKQTIITADGRSINILQIVYNLPTEISGYKFKAEALVMASVRKSLILGVDWLRTHNAIIDVKNQELILQI
ncbi:hypothetical protein AYI70_g7907 [Smittium culicis]|uniref:Uncharacterized protein n=1 Tax=Smittium culicis TaxID=133412 RepID=A0A1R1XID0_9FUNG|nr:hypothetical protein AYI70_g7907 [Smittium culicis]